MVGLARRRPVLAGPAVALVTLLLAFVITRIAGVALRDPDQVASGRLAVALGLVAALVLVDIAWRARSLSPGRLPTLAAMDAVRRERWTRGRWVPVALAVFCFCVTYFAYRNLKSVVPLIRPDELFDRQLAQLDRDLLGGETPATFLHTLLGTGLAADVLSGIYVLLFAFIPISLAVALVFSPDLERGLFYCTALAINWGLAAGTYFLLPSIGPFWIDPGDFAGLPHTAVTSLQDTLIHQREVFVADPSVPGSAQGIGAFASLHVSIYVTGALAAHALGAHRSIKGVVWVLTGLTVISTVYFGWHYVSDDVAGVGIAVTSLALAKWICGTELAHGLVSRPASVEAASAARETA